MPSRPFQSGPGEFEEDDVDDDQPLSPNSVPEGPVSAAPGPRTWPAEAEDSFDAVFATEESALEILESLPVGVVVFDGAQNLRYANYEHVRLLGRDLGDFDGIDDSGLGENRRAFVTVDADSVEVFITCAADLNADGVTDIFDVTMFLNQFDAMDPSADLNGNGQFDVFDVLIFLNAFDDGC